MAFPHLRPLPAGLIAGSTAAIGWTVLVTLWPPIPARVGPALICIALCAAAASVFPATDAQRLLAALSTTTVAAVLILASVAALAGYGPARLIPDLAAAALTPADDLAQSRVELLDPYLWLVALSLTAATLTGALKWAART